jgi:hypothetical protein
MGDSLPAGRAQVVRFDLHVAGVEKGKIMLLEDGQEMPLPTRSDITAPDQTFHLVWTSDGRRHWFRAQVGGPDAKLWLLGNPIYVNWDATLRGREEHRNGENAASEQVK